MLTGACLCGRSLSGLTGTLCGRGSGGPDFSAAEGFLCAGGFLLKGSLLGGPCGGLWWVCQVRLLWAWFPVAWPGRAGLHTHNMKSCSQLGWLPRTAMVVLFTFCTFSVTYVLNFSAAGEWGNGRLSPPGSVCSPQPGGWTRRPQSQNRHLSPILKITRGKWRPSLKGLVFIWEDRQEGLTGYVGDGEFKASLSYRMSSKLA